MQHASASDTASMASTRRAESVFEKKRSKLPAFVASIVRVAQTLTMERPQAAVGNGPLWSSGTRYTAHHQVNRSGRRCTGPVLGTPSMGCGRATVSSACTRAGMAPFPGGKTKAHSLQAASRPPPHHRHGSAQLPPGSAGTNKSFRPMVYTQSTKYGKLLSSKPKSLARPQRLKRLGSARHTRAFETYIF